MYNPEKKIVLGLETGLDGGSVSILEAEKQIDCAEGAGKLSKSEDLLPLIENLLARNGVGKREIGLIAISDAPGSLTGLRIGMAIARGLGASLSAEVFRISVLEALAYNVNLDGRIISALYTEKTGIFYREFAVTPYGTPDTSSEIVNIRDIAEFSAFVYTQKDQNTQLAFTEPLRNVLIANRCFKTQADENKIRVVKGNLAEITGIAAQIKLRLIT